MSAAVLAVRISRQRLAPRKLYHHRCASSNALGSPSDESKTSPAPSLTPKDLTGPPLVPVLGSAWKMFLPKNRNRYLNTYWSEHYSQYGPIYRDQVPIIGKYVMVHDVTDIETMFRKEGKYPRRVSLEVWKRARRELGLEMGLLLSEGESWHRQRTSMSKFAAVPRKVAEFHTEFNGIACDLVANVRHLRDPETKILHDTYSLLSRWSFEGVGVFALGKRLGCMEKEPPAECQEWRQAWHDMLTSGQRLFNSIPIYKLWPTKDWKILKRAINTMFVLAMRHVQKRMDEIQEEEIRALESAADEGEARPKVDFLTHLIYSGKQSPEEAAMNAIEMLNDGIDTTSAAMAWCLYNLANNPEVQEKLRGEVEAVVGSEDIISPAHISKMPYLRNCIKETLRLAPALGVHSRYMAEEAILSGCKVPAGTQVWTPNTLVGRMPQLFHDPESFQPERWDRDRKDQLPHPFASLPFGFGPRNCLGRRIAELELHITLSHLMKEFRVQYEQVEKVVQKPELLMVPDKPINLTIVDL